MRANGMERSIAPLHHPQTRRARSPSPVSRGTKALDGPSTALYHSPCRTPPAQAERSPRQSFGPGVYWICTDQHPLFHAVSADVPAGSPIALCNNDEARPVDRSAPRCTRMYSTTSGVHRSRWRMNGLHFGIAPRRGDVSPRRARGPTERTSLPSRQPNANIESTRPAVWKPTWIFARPSNHRAGREWTARGGTAMAMDLALQTHQNRNWVWTRRSRRT
jgi:hypothetical protein